MSEQSKQTFQERVRRTFIAGIFSFVPLAVTGFVVYWIDEKVGDFTQWLFNHRMPLLGVIISVAAIFVTGMIVTSFVGKFILKIVDSLLVRVPVIRQIYQAWKQIALTPGGGTEGVFSRVVLIPDESGQMRLLGFSSGRIVQAREPMICIFVPSSPNPIMGRLYFAPENKCQFLDMTTEEAFKIILSTGNYVPPLIPRTKAAELMESLPALPAQPRENILA